MNDERSREIIKQLYWIMDNFYSIYKVCKEFLISKEKKANFSNISALLPVCFAVYGRYMQSIIHTYYSLTFMVATNKYYMHSAKKE